MPVMQGQRVSPGVYRGPDGQLNQSKTGAIRIPKQSIGNAGGMPGQAPKPTPIGNAGRMPGQAPKPTPIGNASRMPGQAPKPIGLQPVRPQPISPGGGGGAGHWEDANGQPVGGIDPGFTLGNRYVPGAGAPQQPGAMGGLSDMMQKYFQGIQTKGWQQQPMGMGNEQAQPFNGQAPSQGSYNAQQMAQLAGQLQQNRGFRI